MSLPSMRIAAALAGALFATCAIGAPPASGPASSSPSGSRQHASKNSPMQSDAMRNALGVAMQAFGFAASHPDATEAEKRAAANRMMQGVFDRELRGGAGNGQAGNAKSSSPASPDVPMDAARRAGYEASRAYHENPDSQETADAIRRLILTADGKLPSKGSSSKPAHDDGGGRDD